MLIPKMVCKTYSWQLNVLRLLFQKPAKKQHKGEAVAGAEEVFGKICLEPRINKQ